MIELDEAWAQQRVERNTAVDGRISHAAALKLMREAHERAVKEMSEQPLRDTPQPRTLFEDAALQEWGRLASESKPTDSGYYARYTPDERVAGAIKAARAFVDAVKDEQK